MSDLSLQPQAMAVHAATMVLLMDDTEASALLSQLSPEELEVLGSHMCELGEVAPGAISAAIASFADQAERGGLPSQDHTPRLQAIMEDAVGRVRADTVMRRIQGDARPKALEVARWLDPDIMVMLLEGELPQTIAVMLVQLDPQAAAMVLAKLPSDSQVDVVQRVATLGPVNPMALAMLEQLLEARIARGFGPMPLQVGGVRDAAEIINLAGKVTEKKLMPLLGKRDKKLAKKLEDEMFRFEHLFTLEGQQMGILLREVDSETLIDALKGIEEPQRDVFFGAMSSRAADGLKDEIEGRGRLKAEEVNAAQRAVINVARRLMEDGDLVMGDGGDDYV